MPQIPKSMIFVEGKIATSSRSWMNCLPMYVTWLSLGLGNCKESARASFPHLRNFDNVNHDDMVSYRSVPHVAISIYAFARVWPKRSRDQVLAWESQILLDSAQTAIFPHLEPMAVKYCEWIRPFTIVNRTYIVPTKGLSSMKLSLASPSACWWIQGSIHYKQQIFQLRPTFSHKY